MNKSKNGFSMLGLCFVMLPVFLMCMLVVSSYFLISRYTDTQKSCRVQVLKAQQIMGQKLKELIELNPKAKSLRTQEKLLKIAIAAASAAQSATVAALQVLLFINRSRQAALRAQQERLIFISNSEAKKALHEFSTSLPRSAHAQVQTSSVNLKVYKTPAAAIAPDHLTVPFFKELQTLKISWKIPVRYFVPQFILDFYPNAVQDISGKCSATLIQKGDIWNPILYQAKF